MFARLLAPVAMPLLVAGCAGDIKAEVESDTRWSGVFGTLSTDGQGNRMIDMPDGPSQCATVSKLTEAGYLRLRITVSGGLTGPAGSDWAETTAPFGTVTACSGY
jgi:hypothetical protein